MKLYCSHKSRKLTWALQLQMERPLILRLIIKSSFSCNQSKPIMILPQKQEHSQVGNIDNKRVPSQSWRSLAKFSLKGNKAIRNDVMKILVKHKNYEVDVQELLRLPISQLGWRKEHALSASSLNAPGKDL